MVQLMPLPPHRLLCFFKIQNVFFMFLVPAYPGKEAVKQALICLLVLMYCSRQIDRLLWCVASNASV